MLSKYLHIGLYFSVFIFIYSCDQPRPFLSGKEGQVIPDFYLTILDNQTINKIYKNTNGVPKLIFFFNPYCPYCREQTEEITKNDKELKNLKIIMVSTYPTQALMDFNKDMGLVRFKRIVICKDSSKVLLRFFNPPVVPYLVIVNKDGRIERAFDGVTSVEDIRETAFL
jgi:peroxiredoxin